MWGTTPYDGELINVRLKKSEVNNYRVRSYRNIIVLTNTATRRTNKVSSIVI